MTRRWILLGIALCLAVLPLPLAAQSVPEILYYKFNEGSGTSTANLAVPGAGSNPATVVGHILSPSGGQFNGSLLGVTNSGAQNFVDSGWATNLGNGDWTISFWLDLSGVSGTNPFMYVFGDPSAGSFRCFTNGAAGAGNTLLRGTLSQVVCNGGASQSGGVVVHYRRSQSAGNITSFLNGVQNTVVAQGTLNINGTGPFKVGGYSGTGGTASLQTGTRVDEFRVYNRALSNTEIAQTWNVELFSTGLFASFTASPTSGPAPLAVQFTDTSFTSEPGGITSWAWDFDNNGTIESTAQNPLYTYTVPGTYSVALTVTDGVHPPSTQVMPNYITVDPFQLVVTTSGGGVGDIDIQAPPTSQYPGTVEGYTLVSGATAGPVGAGPFFGITPDAYTWPIFMVPAGIGNPLHWLPAPGSYPNVPFVLPPGSLSGLAGQTLDFVVIYISSTTVQASNVDRATF